MQNYLNFRNTNILHTALILAGMTLLLGLLGWIIGGFTGLFLVAGMGLAALISSPRMAPEKIMNMVHARPFYRGEADGLHYMARDLANQAGLNRVPRLFYLPSSEMNAFAVDDGKRSAIAVSDGLLRHLNHGEMKGVLAHEMAHLRNRDTRVMAMAALAGRITHTLAFIGQIMLLINLPLYLLGTAHLPLALVLVLLAAPTLSNLLQLGLSRTREFQADLEAVRITSDAYGLASALNKLEQQRGNFWTRLFQPFRAEPVPTWMRTHPSTAERIRRLLAVDGTPSRAKYVGSDPSSWPYTTGYRSWV